MLRSNLTQRSTPTGLQYRNAVTRVLSVAARTTADIRREGFSYYDVSQPANCCQAGIAAKMPRAG